MQIKEFIGHFHPVLVHLPIGILLIAALFQLLSRKEIFQSLNIAVGIALFWGMISAIVSCISGFLLSKSDDYDEALVSKHQWLGISVAVISIIAYYLNKKNNRYTKWVMALMVLLIILTGHLGGSITHGSDYLTKAFSSGNGNNSETKRKPIPDVQQAMAYSDVIKPIFESRCYGCHGPNKQKGKLRLDEPDFILKGGKDGKVIVAGKADESNLIERIFLPKDNEDHMPPKEKAQLNKQDLDLLHWWVSSGADFTKKVNELPQTGKIKPILLSLQSGEVKEEFALSDIPEEKVEKANEAAIKKLKDRGVAIFPVALNNNYLSANFVAVDSVTENDFQLLEPLKKQLIWLKLDGIAITDSALATIGKLINLRKLHLNYTSVSATGLYQLRKIKHLQYLNLVGTKVSAKAVIRLKDLKELKSIYLYGTNINPDDWTKLKKVFPATTIDSGGYKVTTLYSDTTEIKEAANN